MSQNPSYMFPVCCAGSIVEVRQQLPAVTGDSAQILSHAYQRSLCSVGKRPTLRCISSRLTVSREGIIVHAFNRGASFAPVLMASAGLLMRFMVPISATDFVFNDVPVFHIGQNFNPRRNRSCRVAQRSLYQP